MTTAAAIAAKRESRLGARDALANTDTPPGTGANSSVSPESLTRIAHGAAAAAGQASTPRLSSDLQNTLRAATTPPLAPGQARSSADGAKPGQSSQINRGNGIDGRS
ncbi:MULTISPECIES: hypothetical protein [unclassified Kribbella]|uniref:hypothetical protein n=1 Tax=unclassified Kribbella TaxID=2644121 RepID=UPI003019B13E